jgi:NADH-quinone oxidoreductase subunit H
MRLGWKLLIPLTLAWVVLVAFMRAAALGWFGTSTMVTIFGRGLSAASLVLIGVVLIGLFAIAFLIDRTSSAPAAPPQQPDEIDPFEGGFPVPPLPGQTLREPEHGIPAVAASTLTAKEESRG